MRLLALTLLAIILLAIVLVPASRSAAQAPTTDRRPSYRRRAQESLPRAIIYRRRARRPIHSPIC